MLFLWTLVRFPKESPNDWEGFTFCASVSNFNNLPSLFLFFHYFIFLKVFYFLILYLKGVYFGMVGMFLWTSVRFPKRITKRLWWVYILYLRNSLLCFGDLFIYSGGPHAMVRFYLDLNASFCCLIDFRCDALPAVISWNGSSLICLSASLSQ